MKKILVFILAVMLLAAMAIPAYAAENNAQVYEDYPFYGRLYIPNVGIDVALYNSISQEVTDREDSANLFKWKDYRGEVIADHNGQEFSKLFDVRAGTKGYIRTKDGKIIRIKCLKIFDGYNGKTNGIVDENGNTAHGLSDYLMYTCNGSGDKVRIFLWNKYEKELAIPLYFGTPKFEYKPVKIPEIKVETNFVQNIVSNWFKEHPLDIQFDFSGIKLW